jgi:hypothetical protein
LAKLALVFAILLIALGVVTYLMAPVEHRSTTALIPALVGALLGICGALALQPNMRMHAMHAAAMVGTLGFLAAIGGAISRWSAAGSLTKFSLIAMLLLTGAFTVLCVRSFIAARRARNAGASGT